MNPLKKIILMIYKRGIFLFIQVPFSVYNLLKYKSRYYGTTYYPERKSKSSYRIFLDQLNHIFRFGRFEEYYYLYGLDVENFHDIKDYLDYDVYMKRRDYLNSHPWGKSFSYTGILRDKFYFSVFMEKMGFNVPKTFGLIFNRKLFLSSSSSVVEIEELIHQNNIDLMGKPLNGIGGIGIFSLAIKNSCLYYNNELITLNDLLDKLGNDYFFLQERIPCQHPDIDKLYPESINTLRITTVRNLKTGEIKVLGRMFLMGARGSHVSNWHYGGVIINVDEKGCFDEYGYSLYEKRILKHPDTGAVFKSFKVPYFEDAVKAAIACHTMLYGIHSVGWDFAILPDGILFIEGNDDWGMAAHQMVDCGLQHFFEENFY